MITPPYISAMVVKKTRRVPSVKYARKGSNDTNSADASDPGCPSKIEGR